MVTSEWLLDTCSVTAGMTEAIQPPASEFCVPETTEHLAWGQETLWNWGWGPQSQAVCLLPADALGLGSFRVTLRGVH